MPVSAINITPHQRALVRRTFGMIAANHTEVARLYYDRLFQLAPQYRALFGTDRTQIQRKFMRMLAFAIAALDDPDALKSAMHALGKRHAGYGVQVDQYEIFGQAFLWAVDKALGTHSTPPVREAWQATYTMIATFTLDGHRG